MNIKQFLIDNYIWILAIILITIITIIGFLADKKKSGKKNEIPQQPIAPIDSVNNQVQMQSQDNSQIGQNQMDQQPNNTVMPQNSMNSMNQIAPSVAETVNTTMPEPNIIQTQQPMIQENTQPTVVETVNNPQPVENIIPHVEAEPMYQPLSEQKPVIAPKTVPNYSNMQTSTMTEQSIPANIIDPNFNNMQQSTPVMPMQPQPIVQPMTPEQSMPTYNIPTSIPDTNNNGTIPNAIPNTGVMPQPINNMQSSAQIVPQPVIPQPIVTPQPVQSAPTYNAGTQMQPNMVGQMTQPVMPTTNQVPPQQTPVNFVFGPQNNNQNM